MSPTILAELLAIRHSMKTDHYGMEMGWFHYLVRPKAITPMNILIAELPERRHYEAMEREDEAFRRAGNRSVCPDCGERAVEHKTVLTYGTRNHPGAEYSEMYLCHNCDYRDM